MKNVTVMYGNIRVLSGLNWTMKRGEHWAITGPNGAGKTTMLSLISGDHPQAYANEIYLFGKRRGQGETIWEIKQRIGIVSSELQIRYRHPVSAMEVMLSGFFDSMGLYRRNTSEQIDIAARWADRLQMNEKILQRPFQHLSCGEQRMILIGRALVKSPDILIMDEPCQGLDTANRRIIFDLLNYIGEHTPTQILYVTHYENEIPSCIRCYQKLKSPGTPV